MQKPNVLILHTDEHNFRTLGCYRKLLSKDQGEMWGPEVVETPNLDWLAKTGALSTSFYCTSPQCCPSRAAMMSGLYPQHNGVVENAHSIMHDDVHTFAMAFKENGYATGYSGKWHLGGSEKPGWASKYNFGFDDNRFMWANGHFKQLKPVSEGVPYNISSNSNGATRENFTTDWLTDRTIEFINEHKDKPFCYMVSYPDPHGPDNVRKPYNRMYPLSKFQVPATFNKKAIPLPKWAEGKNLGVRRNTKEDRDDTEYLHEVMQQYYGMVKCIDDNIGRLKKHLTDLGLIDNTIIVFMADHGDMCGEHHRVNKGVPYEASAKVPFIVRYPQKITAGTVVNPAMGMVDFSPTILGLADCQNSHAKSVQGKDASNIFTGESKQETWEDVSMLRMRMERSPSHWLCMVSSRYKLIVCAEKQMGETYLFDLEKDPNEIQNFINDPKYSQISSTLATQMKQYCIDYNDPHYNSQWLKDEIARLII